MNEFYIQGLETTKRYGLSKETLVQCRRGRRMYHCKFAAELSIMYLELLVKQLY